MALNLASVYQSGHAFAATGASDTASVTVATNDYLVILGCRGDSTQIMGAPSGGGFCSHCQRGLSVGLACLPPPP
jgi:hypothetical protein